MKKWKFESVEADDNTVHNEKMLISVVHFVGIRSWWWRWRRCKSSALEHQQLLRHSLVYIVLTTIKSAVSAEEGGGGCGRGANFGCQRTGNVKTQNKIRKLFRLLTCLSTATNSSRTQSAQQHSLLIGGASAAAAAADERTPNTTEHTIQRRGYHKSTNNTTQLNFELWCNCTVSSVYAVFYYVMWCRRRRLFVLLQFSLSIFGCTSTFTQSRHTHWITTSSLTLRQYHQRRRHHCRVVRFCQLFSSSWGLFIAAGGVHHCWREAKVCISPAAAKEAEVQLC